MQFSFAVCSYGLAKEWNLVLQCGVTVWLRNGIKFGVLQLQFDRWTGHAAKRIVFISESLYFSVNCIVQ